MDIFYGLVLQRTNCTISRSGHDQIQTINLRNHPYEIGWVDTWLQHWLKLQKNKKWPLVLKDPVDKAAKRKTIPTVVIKPKGKKAGYVKRDLDEVSQSDREADGGSDKVAHFTIINHNRINNNAEGGIVYCPTYTTITSKCSQIPEQSLYIPCITF